MRGVRGFRAAAIALAGLSALLIAPKCGTEVIVPAEDGTPPEAKLFVIGVGGVTEIVPARGLRKVIAPDAELAIFVEGTDPSGLMRARITSSSTLVCAAGTMTEERREDVVHTETNDVKPGEPGNTRLLTSLLVDGRLGCAGGLAPRSRRITLFGSVENYHGGVTTTPALVIDVETAPPPSGPPR